MPLTLILGNQLHRGWLQPSALELPAGGRVLMLEDLGLAGAYRYHRLRLLHTFVAMRAFAAAVRRSGQDLRYGTLPESESRPFWQRLDGELRDLPDPPLLRVSEVPDQALQRRLEGFCRERGVTLEVLPSPAFLEPVAASRAWFEGRRRPFMKTFYERQRRRLGLLLTAEGTPLGGRWSYDSENRQRLPRDYREPPLPVVAASPEEEEVRALIERWFPDNPGRLGPLPFPWDHAGADAWLELFLQQRLEGFGPYEDALSSRHDTLHHSLLSPLLNIGLLDPGPLLEVTLQEASRRGIAPLPGEPPLALPPPASPPAPGAGGPPSQPLPPVPIASLEGFLRQVIGWREFVRGIDLVHGERQASSNFWDHHRRLAPCWQDGSSGLPPLDRAIERVNRLAYSHHIERLMVISCLMLLCEIAPAEAHRWFMERYIDSYDWVMGPNVYGMGLMSDGGIFATKPYLCGSNYILKMGDDRRGPWCAIWDGLYWRFIDRHRSFFSGNPRLAMAVRTLDRMDPERRRSLEAAACGFLERATLPAEA